MRGWSILLILFPATLTACGVTPTAQVSLAETPSTPSSRAVSPSVPCGELDEAVGKLLAERAVKNGVTEVVFDRGGYLYHGRVKALADAARESGLSF